MTVIYPHFWGVYSQNRKLWIIRFFFQPSEDVIPLSSDVHCFSWEVSHHSFHCSPVYNVSFIWLLLRFSIYIWFSTVWLWWTWVWFSFYLSCLEAHWTSRICRLMFSWNFGKMWPLFLHVLFFFCCILSSLFFLRSLLLTMLVMASRSGGVGRTASNYSFHIPGSRKRKQRELEAQLICFCSYSLGQFPGQLGIQIKFYT